jgi:phosphatidylserine/phosphatidylglycerophosphate/cardiolipin synthase-like enzyme
MVSQNRLSLAELSSLSATIAGTFASIIYQQTIYAIAPLSIALSLNLFHRRQLEHRIQSQFNSLDAIGGEVIPHLQSQVDNLTHAIDSANLTPPPSLNLDQIETAIASKVEALINERINLPSLETYQQLMRELQGKYEYELVIDRDRSHQLFHLAIAQAQERLILVCPWLTTHVITDRVIARFEQLLKQGCQIDIGWGYLNDAPNGKLDRDLLIAHNQPWKYRALPQLENLHRRASLHRYPGKLTLKLLGTHEKFLVCDRTWAMLGSHNFLASTNYSREREIGLKTTDPRIISELVHRFTII